MTMKKDKKKFDAVISDVEAEVSFSYTCDLLGKRGARIVARHAIEAVEGGTLVTHSFDFTGFFGGLFRWFTADDVQKGLEQNTQELKKMAEVLESKS